MAKLRSDAITSYDLLEFLAGYSDFGFEIQVLKQLREMGFNSQHGGSYDDPVTKKPREFDIRAFKRSGNRFLRLAVECKNLRPNFPLLVSCLPRSKDEAFHEVAWSFDPEHENRPNKSLPAAVAASSKPLRLRGVACLYKQDDYVGKDCNQVGRTPYPLTNRHPCGLC